MALMSAWAGGSLWPSQYLPKWATWLPELGFALAFGAAWYPIAQGWDIDVVSGYVVKGEPYLLYIPFEYIFCTLVSLWSYIWMQTATAPGLHWGKGGYNPDRTSTLKPFVDFISPWHPSTVEYCRLYMGVKGFLITLPVGGFLGFVLWPLGYETGNRMNNHTVSELAAGAGAGLSILIFTAVVYG